jgi:hypothetical protein
MDTQDEIYQEFLAVQVQQSAALDDAGRSLAGLLVEADQARAETARLATGVVAAAATKAAKLGGSAGSSASGAAAGGSGGALSSLWDVFKGVESFASPLIGVFTSLFGGGSTVPAPLIKYALPQSIDFQGVEGIGGQVSSVDYDQSGAPRAYGGAASAASSASAAGGGTGAPGDVAGVAVGLPVPGPQVLDGSSLDPRFFLDRSDLIAAAVRDAMLNSHAINDVINDL